MQPEKIDRPSEEQMWAGPSGQRWFANAKRFEETLRPIGDALLDAAAPSPGDTVIDVGCGAGGLSLDIAQRIAPNGTVIGLDISPDLIAEASRRAAASTAFQAPMRFIVADAAHSPLPKAQADILISRFGSMFFTDPYTAFTHLHSLLRPPSTSADTGRLALAVWAPAKQNPWMSDMRAIVAQHFDLPTPPPRTPGPFAFDDPAYLSDILTKAHFKHINISLWNTDMYVGGPNSDAPSAADFLLNAMSIAQRVTEASPETQQKVRTQLTAHLQTFHTPKGIRMPAAVYLATATA